MFMTVWDAAEKVAAVIASISIHKRPVHNQHRSFLGLGWSWSTKMDLHIKLSRRFFTPAPWPGLDAADDDGEP
jgi:hypothetical protein